MKPASKRQKAYQKRSNPPPRGFVWLLLDGLDTAKAVTISGSPNRNLDDELRYIIQKIKATREIRARWEPTEIVASERKDLQRGRSCSAALELSARLDPEEFASNTGCPHHKGNCDDCRQ